MKCDNNNYISEIKEKEKISDFANTGAYGFNSAEQLKKYTEYILENNIRQKNEFYTSGVIEQMLKDNISLDIILFFYD